MSDIPTQKKPAQIVRVDFKRHFGLPAPVVVKVQPDKVMELLPYAQRVALFKKGEL